MKDSLKEFNSLVSNSTLFREAAKLFIGGMLLIAAPYVVNMLLVMGERRPGPTINMYITISRYVGLFTATASFCVLIVMLLYFVSKALRKA